MSQMKCPSCSNLMEKKKYPDVTIDVCSCGGTFLDKGELDLLATGMSGEIEFCSVDDKVHKDKYPSRKCPKCNEQIMKKNCLLCYSDIVFDYCKKCEGWFLDKDEINDLNHHLENLNDGKASEEFRGYIDNLLVKFDKINDVLFLSTGAGTSSKNISYLRLSIFFKHPLNCGLRIFSEKWTDKIIKAIPLFHKQDIEIEDKIIDSFFVIQGDSPIKIKDLLSRLDVKESLIEFLNKKPTFIFRPISLDVLDDRIIFKEGPVDQKFNYDVKGDPKGIVSMALKIAKLLSQ